MTEQRQSFSALLSLRPVERRKDAFENEQLWQPKGARGVFGGQVIGLALMAALQTIDTSKFGLHSQHCYFILPASSSEKMVIEVDRLRDGKSYATRLVRVKQGHGMVFILAASYTVHPIPLPEGLMERADQVASDMEHLKLGLASNGESPEHWDNGGAIKGNDQEVIIGDEPRVTDSRSSSSDNHDHSEINSSTSRQKVVKKKQESSIPTFSPSFQIPFPVGVIPYEQCEEEQVRWTKFLEKVGQGYDRKKQGWINGYIQERKESAVSIAVTRHRYQSDSAYKSSSVRMVWLKPRLGEDEKPDIETVKAMIGYMTDFHFIGTASRAIGLSSSSNPRLGMMASLDHTVHYYPFPSDFNAGDPLLHVMETVVVDIAAGRAVVRGLVYTQDGVLVAVTSQEGVVRADLNQMTKAKSKL